MVNVDNLINQAMAHTSEEEQRQDNQYRVLYLPSGTSNLVLHFDKEQQLTRKFKMYNLSGIKFNPLSLEGTDFRQRLDELAKNAPKDERFKLEARELYCLYGNLVSASEESEIVTNAIGLKVVLVINWKMYTSLMEAVHNIAQTKDGKEYLDRSFSGESRLIWEFKFTPGRGGECKSTLTKESTKVSPLLPELPALAETYMPDSYRLDASKKAELNQFISAKLNSFGKVVAPDSNVAPSAKPKDLFKVSNLDDIDPNDLLLNEGKMPF